MPRPLSLIAALALSGVLAGSNPTPLGACELYEENNYPGMGRSYGGSTFWTSDHACGSSGWYFPAMAGSSVFVEGGSFSSSSAASSAGYQWEENGSGGYVVLDED